MKRAWLLVFACLMLVSCFDDDQRTQVVRKSDVTLAIRTTGELASARTIELGPPIVKYAWQHTLSFLIAEGTWVETGQRIMAFDTQRQITRLRDLENALATERQRLESQQLDAEQEREQLELDLAQAKMELDKATLKASNVDDLMARLEVEKLRIEKQIAELNYEMVAYRQQSRLAQMLVDQEIVGSEVERLTVEVNEQIAAIDAMNVTAPREGIVVYKTNNDGAKPAEGDQFSVIQKVIEIPDLTSLIIQTTIAEQLAHKVTVGDRVDVRLDAVPERTFRGRVDSLGRIVRVKSRREPSKVFDALVVLDEADADVMRPGMAARLSIVQRVEKDAVAIPQSAIIYEADKAFVRVKGGLGASLREVTIVARQAGDAIITEGLENGDEVLL